MDLTISDHVTMFVLTNKAGRNCILRKGVSAHQESASILKLSVMENYHRVGLYHLQSQAS